MELAGKKRNVSHIDLRDSPLVKTHCFLKGSQPPVGNLATTYFLQTGPSIPDDEEGHLAYKLGDVIEHEFMKCEQEGCVIPAPQFALALGARFT